MEVSGCVDDVLIDVLIQSHADERSEWKEMSQNDVIDDFDKRNGMENHTNNSSFSIRNSFFKDWIDNSFESNQFGISIRKRGCRHLEAYRYCT
jgi:hypothetical protein